MARPKLSETSETVRYQFVATKDLLEKVDAWRFKNRIDTRSEAIRDLIQVGLDACSDDAFEGDNASWAAAYVFGPR